LGAQKANFPRLNERWLAIVNPHAGAIRHGLIGRGVIDELASLVSSIAFTSAPGDATRIAAQARDYSGLVAVGGDGSVSEILTGMDLKSQHLALLPAGTGNCLAADIGIDSARRALSTVRHGVVHPVDVIEATLSRSDGTTTRRRLASTAGMGFASEVARLAKHRFSRLGPYAYAAASLAIRPKRREVRIAMNDSGWTATAVTGLLVNNTCHIGVAQPFPHARIDDGELDAFLFNTGWIRQCLHNFQMVTRCPVPGTPRPVHLHSLRVHCDPPETIMLDGELHEDVSELQLTCSKRSLQCLAPESAA
jgi:diacylglycerol kinase (ATP)